MPAIYNIFTDGAVSKRKDDPTIFIGGAAYVILDSMEAIIEEKSFSKDGTTISQMELMSIIMAVRYMLNLFEKNYLLRNCKVVIHSDSEYIVNSLTLYIKKWIQNGWKTASGEPVKYQEEFQILYDIITKPDVVGNHFEIKHVKGHGKNENEFYNKWNNYVDNLAVKKKKLKQKNLGQL